MSLRLLHRRLAVLMGLAGLVGFAGGAGFEPLAAATTAVALVAALFWHPDAELSQRLDRVWIPLAALLVLRAVFHVFVVRDDVVIPVVDLLFLLMSAEALRSVDAPNDLRLYALSFALVLASTAYRPGVVFLVSFVSYVVLATVALMVGHLRRSAERHRVREVPLDATIIGTTAATSVATLFVAALVFVTFPRVSRGWAGRGETLATSIAGFSDVVSIGEHGSRIYGNPEIVLRVEFPDGAPAPDRLPGLHWRGRSYDRFDGIRWRRSRGLAPSRTPGSWIQERANGAIIRQQIYAAPLDVRVLFTLHPVLSVTPDNGIQPIFDNAGDFTYWGSGAPAYTVQSPAEPFDPPELRSAVANHGGREGFVPSSRFYLQLPDDLDPRIEALADSLTQGLDNRYDKVVAVENWLRSLQYTLELPATAREATLENFLFVRRAGHCEYFSTAMVVMLRTLGIEARNVNGFLGGEWSQFGDYLAVTQNQAHSWVEVWFPWHGWVTFDPTPGGGETGERAAAWFWPGRFLFDALQHRWNKWVLDYSIDSQSGIFQRWSDALGRRRPGEGPSPRQTGEGPNPWTVTVILLLAASGLFWVRRGQRGLPPTTKMYVALREACARAGLGVPPGLTPLALLERIREERRAAGRAAERVVDLYLRARYGHETLGPSELLEMNEALGAARRTLRG